MPRNDTAKWFSVRDDADSYTIDIYGDIGEPDWWEDPEESASTSARQFLAAVREAGNRPIDLHINSGGGSVYDAYAMMTALANHAAPVTAYVDGIAASAATFLCAAADKVVISSVAWMMIHCASGIVWGNAATMRETAEWLEKIDEQISGIYAKRGAHDQQWYADAMRETTWFTADEALEAGLADTVQEAVGQIAASTKDPAVLATAPAGVYATVEIMEVTAPDGNGDGPADPAPCDAADSIEESREDTDAGQEPGAPQAQERLVYIGGKIHKIKDTE